MCGNSVLVEYEDKEKTELKSVSLDYSSGICSGKSEKRDMS